MFFVLLFLFVVVVVSCAFFLLEDLLRLLEDLLRLRCSENCEKRKLLVVCFYFSLLVLTFFSESKANTRKQKVAQKRATAKRRNEAPQVLSYDCLVCL